MKKVISILLTALLLTAGGCSATQNGEEESRLNVVTSTYPTYLFVSAVCDGVDGVSVERLNTGETSCLHDYTLSVDDMRLLEKADVVVLNGAGLEDFMSDALATSSAQVIDCSEGVELLENLAHDHEEGDEDDHDHGHYDPHIWMDPANAIAMVENLYRSLSEIDPEYEKQYRENMTGATGLIGTWDSAMRDVLLEAQRDGGVTISGLITFHDGFQYFARAFDMPLLAAIEEEAGSEASAKEITEITQLVKEYELPIIFTEVNGSDATARAISRETGCAVGQLTMLMDGPDAELSSYYDGLKNNIMAVVNGFAGEEVIQ